MNQLFRLAALNSLCLLPLFGSAQPAHDSYVDLGGYKLFVSQAGAGKSVVVFESGLGEDVSTWSDVQPRVAQFAHTFTYDRAGLDKSDPSPHQKSVESMSSDLHALLHKAGVQPPYILVGHSLGGALVQYFAHTYPTEIAALVLLDPEDGRLIDRLHQTLAEDQWKARQQAMAAVMPKLSDTQRAELSATESSGAALAGALPLPDVPVILFTGTLKDPSFPGNPMEQDLKLQLHNELLTHLAHAKHILVPQSRHYIQNDAPDLVIQAIREVAATPSGNTAVR